MADKRLILLISLILVSAAAFAQFEIDPEPEIPAKKSRETGSFWLSPHGEVSYYGVSTAAYGGGFSLGYGKGLSIGLKTVYFSSGEGTDTLELNFLLRWHFLGVNACRGPFIQIMGGPAIFARHQDNIDVPSELGMVSAGLCFGWSFLFNDRWFIEPAIRAGYPFVGGAGLSAGLRF